MKKIKDYTILLGIILIIISVSIPIQGVMAGPTGNNAQKSVFMQYTPDQVKEINTEFLHTPRTKDAVVLHGGGSSKSILNEVPYSPGQRDQKLCSSCVVWAGTSAMDVAHVVQNKVHSGLSIQWFISNYGGGSGDNFVCKNGVSIQNFVTFYRNHVAIPLSNKNAGYADGNCGDCGSTSMPASNIESFPSYTIRSISANALFGSDGADISQTQAIANIKAAINANTAVIYDFYGNTQYQNDFCSFFWDHPNDEIWNPDTYDGVQTSGGHEVLIVGWDDLSQNPDDHYWIVLNSWGAPSKRPDGTYRLKMNMNYNGKNNQGYLNNRFYTVDVTFNPVMNQKASIPQVTPIPVIKTHPPF